MARGPRAPGLMVDGGGAGVVRLLVLLGLLLIAIAGCSSSPPSPEGTYKLGKPYQIAGRWYHPEYDPGYDRVGVASWYGEPFHGRATANGEVFDRGIVTAAHPTLPLPSMVSVTNLDNGREMTIRVNDRGPFVGDRIIDLSQEAARQLGFEQRGLAPVRVRFVSLADARGTPPSPTLPPAPAAVAERGRAAPPPALAPAQVAAAEPPPTQTLAGRGRTAPPPTPPAVQVAAAEPPPIQTLAEAPARCHGRFIQVGAFAERARAQRMVAELHALEPMPVSLAAPAEDRLARVRLGPIPDPASASAALERLKRFGFAGAFIVAPAEELPTPC
jgi:rare lipoprotein A